MTEKNSNQLNVDNMLGRMADVEAQSGSNTMCLAKWMQSTVYLMNGHTHSCHHPSVHKIPISEIKRKPSALHNTEHKMKVREEMLAGQRPKECQYCWNIEDLPGKHISDRTYKSAWSWAYPNLQQVIESKNGADIAPSYLEVAFDNTCNLKCMYCTPDISSKWMEESQKYGPYPNTTYNVGDIQWLKQIGKMPISSKEENPYVDAFWEWWPELYKSLHTFRITGGEPLLSKNTWRVLEEIKNNPRPDFTLAINTNMQVPDDLLNKLIYYYNAIAPNIKSFDVYTSCEAHGKQAEYIRTGLQYDSFMENIKRFLDNTGEQSRVHLMITFNILSLSTFDLFLKDILDLRTTYNDTAAFNRIPMMISYLRWPQFQDVRVAQPEVKKRYIERIKQFVQTHNASTESDAGMFYIEEIDQVERLAEYMFEPLDAKYLDTQHKDFGAFYQEYDLRRECDFYATFPELADFFDNCKMITNG